MISAFIVDDEQLARERIVELLAKHKDKIQLVGQADLGYKAISQINKLNPDLVFMDIHLPDMNGFDILNKLSFRPFLIFSTAYEKYAIEAFNNLSVDYLVKPLTQSRFDQSIEKLMLFTQQPSSSETDWQNIQQWLKKMQAPKKLQSLTIKKGDKYIMVDLDDVAFFKSEDKYINVCLVDGNIHLLDRSLTELSAQLPDHFMRVHRSFAINRNHILEMEKYFKGTLILTMSDKYVTKIKTGESYAKEVREKLNL